MVPDTRPADPLAAIDAVPLWYHTMEVASGVVTPGWFDLRPVLDVMPWPDVRGKRCLDVGTWDGHLAFELERRGASEVVATDIESHEDWDWPMALLERGARTQEELTGAEKGLGFRVASKVMGSSVERRPINVYDIGPEVVGEFDVVVCGSLLLHLRDPLRALAAIRSVTRGHFLSAETIDLPLSVAQPRRPAMRLDAVTDVFQWFIPNRAGHARMLAATGFFVERLSRPYSIPFGEAHPARGRGPRSLGIRAGRRLLTGHGDGVPHQAALARPR